MTGTKADRPLRDHQRPGAGTRPEGASRPRGRARSHGVQNLAARLSRGITRRRFISGAGAFATGGFAALLIGRELAPALAHSGDLCVFPCGQECSGCSAAGGCPAGYQTCYKGEVTDPNENCCVYPSSYWFVGPSGNKHMCRDCRILYCPCCCEAGCCYGFCGCKSVDHYNVA